MSISKFEREIRDNCRRILNNPQLKDDDIQEWSSSREVVERKLQPNTEVFVACEEPLTGIYCAVLKTADKRPVSDGHMHSVEA
jgi:hypothetical protein